MEEVQIMAEKFSIQRPIAVANFVIKEANDHNFTVTNLQLQKILFFLQGFSLVRYGTKLIDGRFSKWQYGPVQKDVYHAFRGNGSSFIDSPALDIHFDSLGQIVIDHPKLTNCNTLNNEKIFNDIQKFVLHILSIKTWQLVQMTHEENSWKKYQTEIIKHEVNDYTDDEIKQCYQDNIKILDEKRN